MKVLSLNIKRIISTVVIALIMTVPAVYAQIDSCDYDRETNMAQVSGRVKADTAVSLRVKRDNNIVYEDQVNSDAEGVYTHAFKVSGQEGDYIVTVGVTGIKTPYETTLHFYGDLGGLLDEINEISKSGSADNMKEKLLLNLNQLFGTDEELKSTLSHSEDDLALVYKKLADGTEYENIPQLSAKTKQMLALHRIYTASDATAFMKVCEKDKELLLLSGDTAYETLADQSIISDSARNEICAMLYGRDYKDSDEFKAYFDEKVLTYAVDKANGWGNIKEIVEKNSTLLGVDISKVKDEMKLYNYMLKASINSVDDIKKAFNDGLAIKDTNSGNNTGNTGSTGSSDRTNGIIMNDGEKNYYAVANFSDLADVEWAREYIQKLSVLGIVEGMGNGTFMPHSNVTREAFVKMIVTAFDMYNEDCTVNFDDVPTDAWYYSYVASAVKNGIINGVDERNFGSGQPLTRQDMAVIAYRASKAADIQFDAASNMTNFTDEAYISDYAKESVNTLSSCGIINGMGDGTFVPSGYATRAQAAVIIFRLYDLRQ